MTLENAKKFLPIITAFANGEKVQLDVGNNQWRDIDYPDFTDLPEFYRIAPKPRIVFINEYPSGEFSTWPTREIADTNATVERIACHHVELPPLP